MSPEHQITAITKYYETLISLQEHNNIQQQLILILQHLQKNFDSFSVIASKKSPFYSEFFNTIHGQCTHEDTCFALLECIIIFYREKQLTIGQHGKLAPAEQNLLNFYEKSDLWDDEDKTLINQWYWLELPKNLQSQVV